MRLCRQLRRRRQELAQLAGVGFGHKHSRARLAQVDARSAELARLALPQFDARQRPPPEEEEDTSTESTLTLSSC